VKRIIKFLIKKSRKMATLLALASAKIQQGDKEKALAVLQKQVKDNKFAFTAAIHNAEQELDNAKARAEALESDPNATPKSIIDAELAVKLADKNIEILNTIVARRFAATA
jgi:hypothetical protein